MPFEARDRTTLARLEAAVNRLEEDMARVLAQLNFIVRAVNQNPVWTVPSEPLSFTSGIPLRIKIDDPRFVIDPDGDPLSVQLASLDPALQAAGISFDVATEEIVFDGRNIGKADVIGTATFAADDGRG